LSFLRIQICPSTLGTHMISVCTLGARKAYD
jgi:hypothetical protein